MMLNVVVSTLLLAASPFRPLPVDNVALAKPTSGIAGCAQEIRVSAPGVSNRGVANLPFAMGRRFDSLDDYLTHLRCRAAPIDLPWWREIRPDVYEQVKTKPGAPREIATRAQLSRRFGFTK